jgi:hypothetical protein
MAANVTTKAAATDFMALPSFADSLTFRTKLRKMSSLPLSKKPSPELRLPVSACFK